MNVGLWRHGVSNDKASVMVKNAVSDGLRYGITLNDRCEGDDLPLQVL
jgi:hypothetical protein